MDKKQKREKRLDRIGLACGLLLIALAIFSSIAANATPVAGVKDSEIPDHAITLTGTADGRNGPISVEVITDKDSIYRITVTNHTETEGIGDQAVKQLPAQIFQAQNVSAVDAVSGATISSEGIRSAIAAAFLSNEAKAADINPKHFGANPVKAELLALRPDVDALKGEDGHIKVLTSADWAETYPNEYLSWKQNEENDGLDENGELEDYLKEYPMLSTLYDNYGFSWDYKGARGHMFDIEDVTHTERVGGKTMASCFTCKTPVMTAKAIEMGDAAYSLQFEDVLQEVNEPLSCFNCHANAGSDLVVTHTYLTKALGDEINMVDAATLSCGQCHVDYYFAPETKATTLPYTSLESMHPDAILDYYNNLMVDGEVFADYVNPSNGIRQLMVNHPELETFTAEGSVHRNQFTCADCHMGTATAADGTSYKSHYLISPLENQELLDNTCAACHGSGLADKVHAIQAAAEERTYDIGYQLEDLIKAITEAVEGGKYSEEELNAIRMSYRNAQFYWNFVFVENSEGAHNSKLTNDCLDKSEALIAETWALMGA